MGLAISAAHHPEMQLPGSCLDAASSDRLVTLLLALPHGVVKHSHAVQGDQIEFWPFEFQICEIYNFKVLKM